MTIDIAASSLFYPSTGLMTRWIIFNVYLMYEGLHFYCMKDHHILKNKAEKS